MSFRRSGKASTFRFADCLLRRSYPSLPLFSISPEICRLQLGLQCQVGAPFLHSTGNRGLLGPQKSALSRSKMQVYCDSRNSTSSQAVNPATTVAPGRLAGTKPGNNFTSQWGWLRSNLFSNLRGPERKSLLQLRLALKPRVPYTGTSAPRHKGQWFPWQQVGEKKAEL